jgi:hypothetical protein
VRHVRSLLVAMLLCVAVGQPALAQERASTETLEAARALIEASGAAKQFDQVIPLLTNSMMQAFVSLAPNRAGEIRQVMGELVKRFAERKNELIDQIAEIYAKRMSAEDMREVAKFYQSGAGRRLVEAQPQIVQESFLAGQRWGERIGAEIDAEMRRELKKRGVDL